MKLPGPGDPFRIKRIGLQFYTFKGIRDERVIVFDINRGMLTFRKYDKHSTAVLWHFGFWRFSTDFYRKDSSS